MKKFWAILTCTFAAALAAAVEGEILHTNLQARFKTLSFRAGDIRPLATVSISKSHVARLILDQLKGGAYDSSLSVSEVQSLINSFLSGLQADDAQASRIFLVQIGDDQPIDQIRSHPVWVSGWGDEIILTVETLYQFQKPLFVLLDLHELLTQAGIATSEMLSSAGTPKFMSHSRQGRPIALVWRSGQSGGRQQLCAAQPNARYRNHNSRWRSAIQPLGRIQHQRALFHKGDREYSAVHCGWRLVSGGIRRPFWRRI